MTQQVAEFAIPVMTYQTLDDVSETAVDLLLALWVLRASYPEAEWIDLLVNALTQVLAEAEAIGRVYGTVARAVDGDLALPDEAPGQRRRPPEDFEQRSGTAPDPEPTITEGRIEEIREQVAKAFETLAREVERLVEDTERVERMVKDEVVQHMQRGQQDGVRLAGSAGGYRRGVNPDCCELCFWLWKQGYVYPIDQPMHRHIGCRCVPIPTNDPVGRTADVDEAGQALLDRYYTDTLDETSYRRDGKNPNQ